VSTDTGPETPPAPPAGLASEPAGRSATLFGRGLLYVVVYSLQTLAAVVVSPVVAYALGPAEFGRLAAAIALHQLLIALAVVGLDQALVLQHREDGDDRSARGLVTVGIVLAVAVTLLTSLTAPLWSSWLGFGNVSTLLVVTLLWTAPQAGIQLMLALLLSQARLRAFTAVSALSAVGGQVFGLALLLVGSRTAATYAWGAVISQFAAVAIAIVVTRPALSGLRDVATASRAVRLGVPLALSGVAVFVLNAGDRIVIQRELGATEVGRYQVAYTVGYVVVLLLTFTSQAWAPYFASVRDEAQRALGLAAARDELYRLLVPVVLGMTLGAPVALRIVAPASYRPAGLLVVVFLVALSAFPVADTFATGRALVTARHARPLAVVAGIAALVNLGLNLVLVPVVGITGAALATLVTFGLQALVQRRMVPAAPPWPRTPPRLWWAIVAGCACSAVTVVLPQTLEWNGARLAVGVACLPWFLSRLRSARRADGFAAA